MEPFSKIPDASALLRIFPSWPDRDHNVLFKAVGICCSTSLFSPDPEATPTAVFMSGYGASAINSSYIVSQVLKQCGASSDKNALEDLVARIQSLAVQHGFEDS